MLEHLEPFASFHGPDWYGLPRNKASLILERNPVKLPVTLPFGDDLLVPFRAGEEIGWTLRAVA